MIRKKFIIEDDKLHIKKIPIRKMNKLDQSSVHQSDYSQQLTLSQSLSKRKKVQVKLDPIHSHLFLNWEVQPRIKHIKTERDWEVQKKKSKILQKYGVQKNNLIQEKEEQRQLTKHRRVISLHKQKKTELQIKNNNKLPKTVSQRKSANYLRLKDYQEGIIKKNTTPVELNLAKIKKIVNFKKKAQAQLHYQANLNQERAVKSNTSLDNRKQHLIQILPIKPIPEKKVTSSKKQWKQINLLQLETCFAKLKKKKNITELPTPANEQKIKNTKITLPTKQNLSQFIQKYVPMNTNLSIDNLVKKDNFIAKLEQDEFYFGQSVDNIKQGFGISVTVNSIFEGHWHNNIKISGYEKTRLGIFKGQFLNNQREGLGEFFWNNGECYQGEWKKGLKHGSGLWRNQNGNSYLGEWNKGKVEGYGVHISFKGQKYLGNFQNFLKHGLGKQIFQNDDIYQGNYQHGQPNGFGKYIWKCGLTYQGQFTQGYKHGKGKLFKDDGFAFEGQFYKEFPNGKGQLKLPNGHYYRGEFKDGMKHGDGILTIPQKHQIYKGKWKNDKFQE